MLDHGIEEWRAGWQRRQAAGPRKRERTLYLKSSDMVRMVGREMA
jgi:hypothetical protein